MNPRAIKAHAAGQHEVLVEFSNRETRKLNLQPLLQYDVFARLRDAKFVSQVRVDHGTLAWPEGIDLDPDMVYLDSVPVNVLAGA